MADLKKEYPSCASCELCAQINCHPNNKIVGSGNISDILGYICMLWFNDPEVRLGIFMEDDKGLCECHTSKV